MKGKIFNAQEVQAIIAGNKTMFREMSGNTNARLTKKLKIHFLVFGTQHTKNPKRNLRLIHVFGLSILKLTINMDTLALIIIILWWNPQKLITYFLDGDSEKTHQIEQQKKGKNVD